MSFAETWMDLESVIQSEVSQRETNIVYIALELPFLALSSLSSLSHPLLFRDLTALLTASLIAQLVKNPPAMLETLV